MAARAPVNTMYVTHHYRPTGLNQPRGGSEIGQNLRSVPSLRVPSVVVVVHSVSIGVLLSIVSCSRALLLVELKTDCPCILCTYCVCSIQKRRGAARDRSVRVVCSELRSCAWPDLLWMQLTRSWQHQQSCSSGSLLAIVAPKAAMMIRSLMASEVSSLVAAAVSGGHGHGLLHQHHHHSRSSSSFVARRTMVFKPKVLLS